MQLLQGKNSRIMNYIRKNTTYKTFFSNTYIQYTFSFLVLLPLVFLPFLSKGKSFVWNMDGLFQHFPMLQHYGNLLRNLFMGKGFPMVDFDLGLGFDTISTMHYYALGDPIAFLSVFFTGKNLVFFYGVLILMRFYLSGISFIVFSKYWRKDGLCVCLGALIYIFCGYSLYYGIRHPFFMNPMIYLPLLLIGLEEVLRKKKPYLLIIIVWISVMSNFYFFYILTVAAVVYVILRYFFVYRKEEKNLWMGFLMTALRIGGYYLLGIAMAAVIFLPVVYAFMQNGRLDKVAGPVTQYLFYDKDYYSLLLQSIFSSRAYPGYGVELCFSAVTAVSFVILLCNKKFRQLRIVLLMALLGLMIPAFGCFMNGLAYITNRWCFLISLLAAVTFTMTYDRIFKLGKREKIILLGIVLPVYGCLTIFSRAKSISELLILAVLLMIIVILQLKWFQNKQTLRKIVLYAMVVFTLGFHGYGWYQKNGYVNEFLTEAKVKQRTSQGVISLVKDIEDDSFYRMETYGDQSLNEALCAGFHDVSGYFSLMDGNVSAFYKDLEVLNQRNAYRIEDMDNRTVLDTLQSVKYFATDKKVAVPYGYKRIKKIKEGRNKYSLYENKNALPIGYTYDSYMLKSDYLKLSPLEKQNALMNAVILDEECDMGKRTTADMQAGIQKLDLKITADNKIALTKDTIDVKEREGEMLFTFDAKPNCETYLRFSKLDMMTKCPKSNIMTVETEKEAKKAMNVRSIYHNTYFGKENYLINTGYCSKEKHWAKLIFHDVEKYSYDNIEAYSVDMGEYQKQVEKLQKSALQNIEHKKNLIKGTATLDQNGMLFLSIPYSKGWKARADGKKVDILKADTMYMAIPLQAGEHQITLKYVTPWLREGAVISLTAVLIFAWMIVHPRVEVKKKKKPVNKD